MAGVLLGGATLLAGNYAIPHLHAQYREWVPEGGATGSEARAMLGGDTPVSERHASSTHTTSPDETEARDAALRRALLVGGAITLHNAPEGLAIGIAFASGLTEVALVLAVVIGLQNVPDGFAFAVPMGETGMSNWRVLLYTTLSGLVPQITAAVVGFSLISVAAGLFPIASGVAAGAMLAVVFRELIPASHGHGHADAATVAFLLGFVLIVVVDAVVVV